MGLADVGKGHRCCTRWRIRALQAPAHLYDLMPIAVLIGTIYALARLAQSSEFTILRTGGLGPGRALSLLAQLGLGIRGGDLRHRRLDRALPRRARPPSCWRAPRAAAHRAAGAWLKDKRMTSAGELNIR